MEAAGSAPCATVRRGAPPVRIGGEESFWFHGIHGVEELFAIMGPGCKIVVQSSPSKVVGVWNDGRTGTFFAKNKCPDNEAYGATVEGTKGSGEVGSCQSYEPLVIDIVKFFKTGKPPVDAEETLEVLAFMEAADESARQNGSPVQLDTILKPAKQDAAVHDLSSEDSHSH